MGDFTDIVSGVRNFFSDISRCKIFFSIVRHERYFFSVQDIFLTRNLFACFYPLEISLQDIFSEITHNRLRS